MKLNYSKPKEFWAVGMILTFCANSDLGRAMGLILLFFWIISSDKE